MKESLFGDRERLSAVGALLGEAFDVFGE